MFDKEINKLNFAINKKTFISEYTQKCKNEVKIKVSFYDFLEI